MGRLKNGIQGGVSGKVGDVILSSWKGIEYVRSRPVKYHDAKTRVQVKQRSRFSITMEFLRTITPFLRIGFRSDTDGRMTAFNAAMSYNMKHAVKVEHQEVMLDYRNARVSMGPLSSASGIRVEIVEEALQISWEANPSANARHDDIAMVLAYNPVNRKAVYDLNAAKRAHMKAILPLTPSWKGDAMEVYLAFKTADGLEVSDSVHASLCADE
ncbi:DUF6266 family protein [Proteiniphilum sp.]|uniref:DUF6266 family protein n=1 Tax=Proteiniphilum sp. TaxID=1926877 RepID=UPI003332A933